MHLQYQSATYQNMTVSELVADPTDNRGGCGRGWNLSLLGARLRLGDFYRSQSMLAADLARMVSEFTYGDAKIEKEREKKNYITIYSVVHDRKRVQLTKMCHLFTFAVHVTSLLS